MSKSHGEGKSQSPTGRDGEGDRIINIDIDNLPDRDPVDRRPEVQELFKNIKERLPELESMLQEYSVNFAPGMGEKGHWTYEDPIYRFYHHSFKVFYLQEDTLGIVEMLRSLRPGCELNKMFMEIIAEGTGKEFNPSMNVEWMKHTRPIVEAFFHSKFMLEMAIKYGKTLEYPPCMLPSGWAALLYLYGLR
ncbi:MAG: hypothetical protein M0Z64_11710 [Nitrospiraceae bacterium]|nr:hypothetical protein [Nitrospiraceae bacterium]